MSCDPCNQPPCCPETPYVDTGCLSYPDTDCVIFNHNPLPSLNIAEGDNLTQILIKLEDVVGTLTPGTYGSYNYGCLTAQGWDSEQKFVEGVSSILCQVLGSQNPGSVTSLSTLNNNITTLTSSINAALSQTLVACYGTMSALTADAGGKVALASLLTAIQNTLCAHNSSITTLTAAGGNIALTVQNTNHNVLLTSSGLQGHTLSADVKISADPSNALSSIADGLLVPKESPLTIANTSTVQLSASGTANHTLSANVKISANSGNQLVANADGLFVAASAATGGPIIATDSDTIDLTVSGADGHTLRADVKIDPTTSTQLSVSAQGLKFTPDGKLKVDISDTPDYLENQVLAGVDPANLVTITITKSAGKLVFTPSINIGALCQALRDAGCVCGAPSGVTVG